MSIFILAVLLVGCSLGGGKIVAPTPKASTGPGDPSLMVGSGRRSTLHGQVTFGSTGLGFWSTVTFNTESIITDWGHFYLELPQGENEYVIRTLIGEHRGVLLHDGRSPRQLQFPVFGGWSREYFDALLTTFSGRGYTVRWPRHAEVPVWIQSPSKNPNVSNDGIRTARQAFMEWEDALSGVITFKETGKLSEAEIAGIVTVFTSREELEKRRGRNVIGYCEAHFYPMNGELLRGRSRTLHLHEIGHCIGLGHSPTSDEVMSTPLPSLNQGLTERETNMARLLYSLPGKTPAFRRSGYFHSSIDEDPHDIIVVQMDTYKPN